MTADEHNRTLPARAGEGGQGGGGSLWGDLPLRFKGLVVVGLPVLGLMISSVAFFAAQAEDRRAQSSVNRALEVQAQLRRILSLAIDAETGARGYVITRQDVFLEPYLAARDKLPAALDRLGSLVRDPAQRQRLAPLRQSIDERLRVSEEIRRFPAGGEAAPPGLVALLEQGKAATENVRGQVVAIEAAEDRLLAERRARAGRAHDRALATIAASLVLGLVGGAAASLLFTRGVARRVARLEDNARRLEAGQELVAFAPGGDEIGRLGRGLERAASLLAEREASLRQARAFLEHLLTSGPVVVVRLDVPEGVLSYASPNVDRLLGLTADQARTAGEWAARIHADDRSLLRAVVQRVTEGSSAEVSVEFRFRRGEGDERWLSALVVAERPDEGRGRGVLGYLIDITERRQAEEARREREATLQAIIATSPDVVTLVDPEGRVRLTSPAVRRMLGYDPAELLGRDALELVHPDDQPAAVAVLASLVAGEADEVALQYQARHADGRWLTIESHACLLTDADDHPTGVVAISRDVTERARLQQAQQQAREAAESANRSKSEFLSRMSHELRTPLNAVLGFAQLLELDELTEDQQEAVGQIMKGGRHLLELINEVLDITRIETGHLTLSPEPVLVPAVLNDALDLVRPLAAARHVHLIGDVAASPDTYVFADRQRLKQILLNLLSNAIKYNRTGGSVSVFSEPVGNTRLRIEVSDTGRGIRPEHVPLLFTPFERLDAEQTDVEGTGMGLALSRRLAEAMGGTLDVSSTPGQGSTFWVELALVEDPVGRHVRLRGAPGDEQTPPVAPPRHRLVHIEDNLSNLRLVERILARGPAVEVIAAMQGRIGLDLARQHHPSVILLDLHLPDMSGVEVLQRLRDDPATASIPVIVVSADATPGQAQRLLAAGALAFLTKPLDARELLRLLGQTLDETQ